MTTYLPTKQVKCVGESSFTYCSIVHCLILTAFCDNEDRQSDAFEILLQACEFRYDEAFKKRRQRRRMSEDQWIMPPTWEAGNLRAKMHDGVPHLRSAKLYAWSKHARARAASAFCCIGLHDPFTTGSSERCQSFYISQDNPHHLFL
jgi:hypothetical protein